MCSLLDPSKPGDIQAYLVGRGLIPADVPVTIAPAGAGNMNLTLRVTPASGRAFIVKQARPWVAKYPTIPAPFERTLVEAAFYAEVARDQRVSSAMPAVLHVDRENHVLALEDVGSGGDFTSIYGDEAMPALALAVLIVWLGWLGDVTPRADSVDIFANRAMRALNHEHLFSFPLRDDNGLDLDGITPGLRMAAREMTADRAYVEAVAALGRRYLSDGQRLVHGDYFPGSWLRSGAAARVIDPEFCFLGDAEFDYGVLLAHLMLARSEAAYITAVTNALIARRLDPTLAAGYAGVEIMRRLIGVAQLPLVCDLDRKRALLGLSRRLVLEPWRGFAC